MIQAQAIINSPVLCSRILNIEGLLCVGTQNLLDGVLNFHFMADSVTDDLVMA